MQSTGKKINIYLYLFSILLSVRCSSFVSLQRWSHEDSPVVYSGIRSLPETYPSRYMFFDPSGLFLIIDAPFSLGMDTLLLPISIPFAVTMIILWENNREKYASTPQKIRMAIDQGNSCRLERLLPDADVNARDEFGWTPLHYATKKSDLHIVKLLIAKGAQINAKDKDSRTPLFGAVHTSLKIVKAIVQSGADVNAKDLYGYTPLIWAAASRDADSAIIDFLISAGANVNSRGWRGRTPLHWAAAKGNAGVARLLLRKGADLKIMDDDKSTALDLAVMTRDNDETVEVLMEAGAKE